MNRRMHFVLAVACAELALAAVCTRAFAQTPVHIESALPWSNGAVTNAALDARIHDGAARYRAYAPVPRYALYDMAYPLDSAEAAAMHGYGILVVTALVQDSTELPLAKVYVRDASGERGMTLVVSTASHVPTADGDVRATFGQFRWDGIFLFPLSARSEAADVLADFSAHRQGFRLMHFAGDVPDQLVRLKIAGTSAEAPPDAVVWTMIRREYPDLAAQFGPK